MSKKNQKAVGVKVYSNGKTEIVTFEKDFVSLKEMQDAVNGYIEFVYLPDNIIMVVNEEGKINRLPVNSNATKMYAPIINDVIVGDVLIIDSKYIN
jgi:hypothetical protein